MAPVAIFREGKEKKRKRSINQAMTDAGDFNALAERKPKNKQRVLLLSSRGITQRMRHLLNDMEALLPHVKKGRFVTHRRLDGC